MYRGGSTCKVTPITFQGCRRDAPLEMDLGHLLQSVPSLCGWFWGDYFFKLNEIGDSILV